MRGQSNSVRRCRKASGLSQAALAEAAGLSRQSVHAVEACRTTPAVNIALRLARALDCTVEALFGDDSSNERISAEVVGNRVVGRVALARTDERWCSYPLTADVPLRMADAIAVAPGHRSVEPLRSTLECRQTFVLMGCAPALGLLADRLNARPGPGRRGQAIC